MNKPKVVVSLSRSEAIVLIEFLMRFRDKDRLAAEHEAEQQLLWDLCSVVETQLPELFDPKWRDLVESARAAVLASPDS